MFTSERGGEQRADQGIGELVYMSFEKVEGHPSSNDLQL